MFRLSRRHLALVPLVLSVLMLFSFQQVNAEAGYTNPQGSVTAYCGSDPAAPGFLDVHASNLATDNAGQLQPSHFTVTFNGTLIDQFDLQGTAVNPKYSVGSDFPAVDGTVVLSADGNTIATDVYKAQCHPVTGPPPVVIVDPPPPHIKHHHHPVKVKTNTNALPNTGA